MRSALREVIALLGDIIMMASPPVLKSAALHSSSFIADDENKALSSGVMTRHSTKK